VRRLVAITLERGPDGGLCGYRASGHTGLAAAGQDVACAAISALVQTAALGLERRLGIAVEVDAGDGLFTCRLPAELAAEARERAEDLLETMRLGLAEIARLQPGALRLSEETGPRTRRR
jgi:hypothetical protein